MTKPLPVIGSIAATFVDYGYGPRLLFSSPSSTVIGCEPVTDDLVLRFRELSEEIELQARMQGDDPFRDIGPAAERIRGRLEKARGNL